MSPADAAPRIASVTAWQTASASECPCSPLSNGIAHAAENQRPVRHETMQVVAIADSHDGRARRSDEPLGQFQVVWRRDLQVAHVPVDDVDAMTGLLREHGLVGRIAICAGLRQCLTQHAHAKRLRRLGEKDFLARQSALNHPCRIGPLDRVGRLQGCDRRPVLDRRGDRAFDEPGRHERSRRVVNQDDIRTG